MKSLPKFPRRLWLLPPVALVALVVMALFWWLGGAVPDTTPGNLSGEAASGAARHLPRAFGQSPSGVELGVVVAAAGNVDNGADNNAENSTGGNDLPSVAAPASVDIFAVRTWQAPAPPADQTSPAPPQAPPLPFRFLGRIVEPGKNVAFVLGAGQGVVVVTVGDSIGGDYRVEKYENGQLLFHYRPMNIRQSLDVGVRS